MADRHDKTLTPRQRLEAIREVVNSGHHPTIEEGEFLISMIDDLNARWEPIRKRLRGATEGGGF